MTQTRTHRTPEEKARLIELVQADVKQGMTTIDSCKKHGLVVANYYNWVSSAKSRKATRRKRKKNQPTVVTALVPQIDKIKSSPDFEQADPAVIAEFAGAMVGSMLKTMFSRGNR